MTTSGRAVEAADELRAALEGLSTDRLRRLVNRLEADRNIRVTVGAWRPQCPMVLAGFDPSLADSSPPEVRFALAWDRFATPTARCWAPLAPLEARRREVQLLLGSAQAVLWARIRIGGSIQVGPTWVDQLDCAQPPGFCVYER